MTKPLPQSIDYVCWTLGIDPDSFHGRICRALSAADGNNRGLLRAAYPHLVAAVEAWEQSPSGEFEIPDLSNRHRAACGCEIGPGVQPTFGDLRAHRAHTTAAFFFWAVLTRKDGQDVEATMEIVEALRYVGDLLDRLFPESAG